MKAKEVVASRLQLHHNLREFTRKDKGLSNYMYPTEEVTPCSSNKKGHTGRI